MRRIIIDHEPLTARVYNWLFDESRVSSDCFIDEDGKIYHKSITVKDKLRYIDIKNLRFIEQNKTGTSPEAAMLRRNPKMKIMWVIDKNKTDSSKWHGKVINGKYYRKTGREWEEIDWATRRPEEFQEPGLIYFQEQ